MVMTTPFGSWSAVYAVALAFGRNAGRVIGGCRISMPSTRHIAFTLSVTSSIRKANVENSISIMNSDKHKSVHDFMIGRTDDLNNRKGRQKLRRRFDYDLFIFSTYRSHWHRRREPTITQPEFNYRCLVSCRLGVFVPH